VLCTSLVIISSISSLMCYSFIEHHETNELHCLTMNIYHEARGEPDEGKYAVAKVTLNRVASKYYPNTICEVVYEKRWDRIRKRYVSAFSWTELEQPAAPKMKLWKHVKNIAVTAYQEHAITDLDGALFYHADHIRPSWSRQKTRVTKIGRHIFYL